MSPFAEAPTERSEPSLEGEAEAIRVDAEQRLAELRRVRAILWRNRDDALVGSELSSSECRIRATERALREGVE